MRQSTIIFGSLLVAFIMYITLRGQVPAYLALFTAAKATNNESGSNSDAVVSASSLNEAMHNIVGDISFNGGPWISAGSMTSTTESLLEPDGSDDGASI